MTTPNQRPSYKSSRSTVSSRSFLRQIFDEIRSDASQKSAATIKVNTSLKGSHDGSDASPRQRPSLRRLQIPSSRFITHTAASGEDTNPLKSPLMFCDSDLSSTPSPDEPPTSGLTAPSSDSTPPTSASTASHPETMRTPPPTSAGAMALVDTMIEPQPLSKQMRTTTMPETCTQIAVFAGNETQDSLANQRFSGDNRRVIRNVAFIERAPVLLQKPNSPSQQLPEPSSFRPDIASPEGPALTPAPQPITPVRHTACRFPSATPEPPETPSFLRPLHLFDTSNDWTHDISIYKNTQGEEWKRNSLCRHCFQSGGAFNRIMTYGYEACGRDERLDSHYWEPMA
ncbi:hypothetical protein G6011_05173 [Alternaria panax]|uniref:Uncharacterized protein n=1 Tax=Alternaria panax TaxID=48097 RepID=A0AAD4I6J9_9PLEO|nr:hypothetical protein G6011_05173 [Alternaria panax]